MAGWQFFLSFESETIQVTEPVGWDSVSFSALRTEFDGVDQPFTSDLVWDTSVYPGETQSAAAFIKAIYAEHFINANIRFFIQSDVNIGTENYDFDGYLDLSVYSEKNVCDTDGWEITTGVLQDDFREKFKARSDVEIDLLSTKDLDQNTIPELTLKTVRLHCQELYLQGIGKTIAPVFEIFANVNAVFPLYWQNSDFKGVFGNTINPIGFTASTTNVIFQNNSDFTRIISIDELRLKFRVTNYSDIIPPALTSTVELHLIIYDETHSVFFDLTIETSTLNPGDFHDFDTSTFYLATLPPGYSFQVLLTWDTPIHWSLEILDFENNLNSIRISELNSSAYASLCQGLTIEQFLRRALYIITGNSDPLISDFFSESGEGCQWNNLITTGLYIRGAQLISDNPGLKTSFKKFFTDLSRIFCLGYQFEQQEDLTYKIRIEPKDYFYGSTEMGNFENVGELVQNAMTDKLVNSIDLGYSDSWRNIAVSGIWSIHTNRNYFVKNKATTNGTSARLDLKTDIIGEGYAIEFSRRLQFLRDDSGSSDRPNDYNFFIIWLNPYELDIDPIQTSGYQLPNETGSIIFAPGTVSYGSNFIAASEAPIERIYNVLHTPARIAARWWKILGMHTFGLSEADAKLFFQAGEYYTSYASRITSESLISSECNELLETEGLVESTDISPEILKPDQGEYLFKPIGCEFSYPQSLCDFLVMSNPGNGYIVLSSGSTTLYGYFLEVENQPEDPKGGTTKFKLILSNQLPETGPFSDGFSSGFE